MGLLVQPAHRLAEGGIGGEGLVLHGIDHRVEDLPEVRLVAREDEVVLREDVGGLHRGVVRGLDLEVGSGGT